MAQETNPYRGVFESVLRYWRIYGGWRDLLRSPYFHVSVVLVAVTADSWINYKWWLTVTAVVPNLLGFTLGGFAIFLGFGDERFKTTIAGNDAGDDDHSPYLMVSATFMHFVVIQILALLWAVAGGALYFDLPWPQLSGLFRWLGVLGGLVGYWLFIYGVCLAAAAGFAIFRVAGWYDEFQTRSRPR